MGDKIHHQLQSIIFKSFNTMKAMVKAPTNPIPAEELFEFSFDICFIV